MKKSILTAAALAATMLFSGCAVVAPTVMGQVTSSRVTSYCSTAASIKNQVNNFLTESDTYGHGMMRGKEKVTIFSIKIENNTWTVTADNTDCFRSTDKVSWYNDSIGSDAGISKQSTDNALTLLEIDLADLFTDIENGYAKAYIQDGKCERVYYTADSTTSVSALDAVISDENAWDNYKWDSGDGVTADGCVVGTAPVIRNS